MAAMEEVEVDFREFKVKVIWEDGEVGCPWVGIAGDRASAKIVGRTVEKSETAEGYVALTRNMVEAHGIPDRVVQDNGAGGNGLRMMGGKTPLVRRKDRGERNPEWAVPGVYEFLQIDVVNHGPRMAWAKFVESLNSIMRHVDNDPAFYRAQRSGPTAAPNPDPVPVPIALFRAVLDRAIADLNADTESRAQGLLKGECRNAGFQRLSAGRTARWPSPLQLRWMRLSWHLHKVTNSGQVKHGPHFWGDGTTQRAMLHYAEQSVVIGIEPDNPAAPAMVYEWNDAARTGRLLLEKLPAVIEARHADPASKVRAQAEKRRAKAAANAEVIPELDTWVAAERARILQEMGLPVTARPAPKVTKLTTGGPFSPAEARHQPAQMNARTKTDLYFAMKAEEKQTASGGTR
jgi:Bacteriophage Mu transposase